MLAKDEALGDVAEDVLAKANQINEELARDVPPPRRAAEAAADTSEELFGSAGVGSGSARQAGRDPGARSAIDPEHLAPSTLGDVDDPSQLALLQEKVTRQTEADFARRGEMSQQAIDLEADRILDRWNDRVGGRVYSTRVVAKMRRRGQAGNAAEIVAMDRLTTQGGFEVAQAASEMLADPHSIDAQAKVLQRLMVLQGLSLQEAGAKSEAGRALAVLREVKKRNEKAGALFRDYVEETFGSMEDFQDIVGKIASVDPRLNEALDGIVSVAARVGKDPGIADRLYFAWVNGLLRGPKTFIVNGVGPAIMMANRITRRTLAGAIDHGFSPTDPAGRERFIGEAWHDATNLGAAVGEAGRALVKVFRSGGTEGLSRWSVDDTRQLNPFGPRTIAGRLIGLPTTANKAVDEFFRVMSRRGSAHSLAYRIARKEGLEGEEMAQRMAQIVSDPDEALGAGQSVMSSREFLQQVEDEWPDPFDLSMVSVKWVDAPNDLGSDDPES